MTTGDPLIGFQGEDDQAVNQRPVRKVRIGLDRRSSVRGENDEAAHPEESERLQR